MTRALLVALLLTPVVAAEEPEVSALLKKAEPYRPTAAELTFREIPWLTEPDAALKQAKAESRPLFVWLAGGRKQDGSPLERC